MKCCCWWWQGALLEENIGGGQGRGLGAIASPCPNVEGRACWWNVRVVVRVWQSGTAAVASQTTWNLSQGHSQVQSSVPPHSSDAHLSVIHAVKDSTYLSALQSDILTRLNWNISLRSIIIHLISNSFKNELRRIKWKTCQPLKQKLKRLTMT